MGILDRSLLTYFQDDNSFEPYEITPSKVSLQDIKIENSSNANFFISFSNQSQVENVELVNVESKRFPVFFFQESSAVSVKNIYGRNIAGSVVFLYQVLSQNLEDLTFYNVSISQEKSLIILKRYPEPFPSVEQSTVIADFFINVNGAREEFRADFIIGI